MDGDPIRVSVCHCLACQRRTGSAFGIQARFDAGAVTVEGEHQEYLRISDDGDERRFHFCPRCGATVFFVFPAHPEMVAIPAGAFADPSFPPPVREIYEDRRHPWVRIDTGQG